MRLAQPRELRMSVVDAIAVNAETRPDASETAAEAVICFGIRDHESGVKGSPRKNALANLGTGLLAPT